MVKKDETGQLFNIIDTDTAKGGIQDAGEPERVGRGKRHKQSTTG